MAAPRSEVVQMQYRNPHAQNPLVIPVLVVCNTPDEELERNIRDNASRDLPWVWMHPAHERMAVMVGGGPSAADFVDTIRELQEAGATVFAMNAASQWLRGFGIESDYQVVADAKEETSTLVDRAARGHLIASQVNAKTMDEAPNPTLWHLAIDEEMDRLFPPERVKRGGYALIGGGAAVGNAAMCVAYAMGYRNFQVFGYDSSHRAGKSHAYSQPMNDFIPCVDVEWAGRTYYCSVAMKAQAEKFQFTAQSLQREGCVIAVHGEGLLPAMWNTPVANLTERDKYRLMWRFDSYRTAAPGEGLWRYFVDLVKPDSTIIDFGCGTGRAALALAQAGHKVILVDFADNCRDEEALSLPFLEWDLSLPCPLRAKYGLCTDVMEHIPPEQVDVVLANIMGSAENVFFQISLVDDVCGALIGQPLHLSVHPYEWWLERLERHGEVVWSAPSESVAMFYVKKKENACQ